MVLPLLWILLAALAFVLGWTTATPAFSWAGFLMGLAWLVGAVGTRVVSPRLTAVRTLSVDRIHHDGEATVEVTVRNGSRLPAFWLVASESLPAGLSITGLRGRVGPLAGGDSFTFRYALHGARRGYYQIGPTLLRTGEIFGLVQRDRPAGDTDALTVFPRLVPITHARLPSRRPAGEVRARQRVLEDPTQIIGIRPYQHGDGLRRVHWRATAHTGRLQSKLFEVSSQVENMVVVNLRRVDYPSSPSEAEEAADLAVTAAASICHHILERRQRTGLLALGRDPAGGDEHGLLRIRAARGRGQLTELLSALGRVELGPAEDLGRVLAREKETFNWGALIVVITPELTPDTATNVLSLRSAGFEVRTVLVGRAGPQADAAGLSAFGVDAMLVRSEPDIRALGI
ncbi:MAG: DUF58 domain-containing protein [Armatimonadetes bacterium]|nr:DUF58 domain-containing protein [Armatimonadota bacterium]